MVRMFVGMCMVLLSAWPAAAQQQTTAAEAAAAITSAQTAYTAAKASYNTENSSLQAATAYYKMLDGEYATAQILQFPGWPPWQVSWCYTYLDGGSTDNYSANLELDDAETDLAVINEDILSAIDDYDQGLYDGAYSYANSASSLCFQVENYCSEAAYYIAFANSYLSQADALLAKYGW